jgi:hypothetical protein
MRLHDHSPVMRSSLAAALLAATATVALAQQGAPKTPPYSTQSGSAADPVAPMVYDPTSNAFVPQGSGFAVQSFTGVGALQIATAGIGTVMVQASGNGSGLAFVFQGSSDAGLTWQTLAGFVPSSGAAATSFSGNGVWQVNPAGFTLFRINLAALAAGTETFTVTTSTAPAVFNGANIALTATTVTANPGVGLAASSALGCAGASLANTVFTPISQSANTKLVTKATSKTVYLCGLFVVGADAEDLSLVSGTQTTTPCDTGTAAMIGGTSAANGPNLAANGGFNVGNGQSVIAASGAGADMCLFQNGSGRVSGYLVTAQF